MLFNLSLRAWYLIMEVTTGAFLNKWKLFLLMILLMKILTVLTIKLSFWLLTTLHKRFLQMPNTSIRYQRTEKFPSQETWSTISPHTASTMTPWEWWLWQPTIIHLKMVPVVNCWWVWEVNPMTMSTSILWRTTGHGLSRMNRPPRVFDFQKIMQPSAPPFL